MPRNQSSPTDPNFKKDELLARMAVRIEKLEQLLADPRPWNAEWGSMIPVTKLTAVGPVLGGLGTVFSAPEITTIDGRQYEIGITFSEGNQVGAGVSNIIIADDTTQLASIRVAVIAAAGLHGNTLFTTVVPGAGLHTYRFRTVTTATSFQVVASAASPAEITIRDIGPAL
jgi:hypothetical protein